MSAIFEASGQSGSTLYGIIRNSAGQVWNGAAFEAFNSSNWSTYVVSMSEQSPTGYYNATFPAAIAGGKYSIVVHRRDGGSPATSDTIWAGPSGFEFDGTNEISLYSIRLKTDALPDGIQKNTALANFEFLMVSSSDHVTPATGLTITATRSIDGAAFGACANAVSEVASGIYKINLAAADLNGDVITFLFTAAGADARYITVKTDS